MTMLSENHLARPIIRAAKRRATITYGELGEEVGVIARGLGPHLARLEKWCSANRLPPLTVLVVSLETGRPSPDGRYRGVEYGKMADGELELLQNSVFDHDWSQYGKVFG
jgi:hypothetical protein